MGGRGEGGGCGVGVWEGEQKGRLGTCEMFAVPFLWEGWGWSKLDR